MQKHDFALERMREERVSLQIRIHFAELALRGEHEARHCHTHIGKTDTTSLSLNEASAELARLDAAITQRRLMQRSWGGA